eukprot:TRINITY_DN111646_c0_g1_i1.p1 TRINITY_DN111646_c0_g1~~TRINITY_DN111646_c0_g1_i1.p1  ORF type:complete len:427 (-),score=89.63 TRINITY_DN111646_c0_g1_i1:130-1410(-)
MTPGVGICGNRMPFSVVRPTSRTHGRPSLGGGNLRELRAQIAAQAAATAATASLGGNAVPVLDAEGEREFGGRFLPEYQKRRLLGRGACGAVWLATSPRHNGAVAVKQVVKGGTGKHRSDEKAANNEIAVGELLFHPGGGSKLSPQLYPGMRHITRLLDVSETKQDLWLIMELGGSTLTKMLFEIKGEFVSRGVAQPRERVYRVHHLPLYQAMKRDPRILKRLLRQILEALRVLSDFEIVHSDLKPENVLVDVKDGDFYHCEARLCDFGSAFAFDRPDQLALATPEYMPPEALHSCINQLRCGGTDWQLNAQPWSYDMWSLGAIMLEIAYGVPHWLSYKCRVLDPEGQRDLSLLGLFAMPGRDSEKVLLRQQEITSPAALRQLLSNAPGVALDEDGLDLLSAFLEWDAAARISPSEALEHPYLRQA